MWRPFVFQWWSMSVLWSYPDDTSWPIDDISVSIPFPSKMYSGTILKSYMDHDYSNRFRSVDWTCSTETHLMSSYRKVSARVKWFEMYVVAVVVRMVVFVGWVVPSLRVIVLLQPISKRKSSIALSSSLQCE